MNILLLGNGGREHAFAWKMSQSPLCDKLYIAPGNAGTAGHGQNLDIDVNDFQGIKEAVLEKKIDLVVVGPEAPLVNGIYDFFKADAKLEDVQVIGPSREGAKLEGSKAYAKAFMQERHIPTADYREFTADQLEEGLAYIAEHPLPIVLKADGLAAGKGVLILHDVKQAQHEFKAMLNGKFGEASAKVVVEEFLDGIEFSVFVLTDGKSYKILPVAKDYKRVGEGDTGLNTGGMGSVSPVPFVTKELIERVEGRIIRPTIAGLQEKKIKYKGFIFFGLINCDGDPYVIEYNCRMGDPETQVVFPRLKTDLVELFIAMRKKGKLAKKDIEVDSRTATAIVLVSGGYPGAYEKGHVISGLDRANDCLVFHAGSTRKKKKILTDGGRVLAVTALGKNIKKALKKAKDGAKRIQFQDKYYRKDIGFDLLDKVESN